VDGDQLTITAKLADGNPLPGWLSFDGSRFTGTPPANYYGAADIEVTASDGALSVSDVFRLTINPVNDAPVVLAALADVANAEDSAFNILLPEGSFGDVDGDALSYTARLASGDPLPSWISFDGARFTGTPPANFNGAFDIDVTASDGTLRVSDRFRFTITSINDAPTLEAALVDISVAEDNAVSITLSANSFGDVDGDVLSYIATLASGAALPTWLSFASGVFTGTPPQDFSGVYDIRVTAIDGVLSVSDTFRLTISPVNDAPVVSLALIDRVSQEDAALSFVLPAGSFTDVDGDALALTATLLGGAPLPSWLSFDGSRFTGTPPVNFNGVIDLAVTASDGALSVTDSFRLGINPVNDRPTLVALLADVSIAEDTGVDILIPAGSFADVDGDNLTLTANLANGTALPSWLIFAGGRLTGQPPANFNGSLDIEVLASDGALTVSDVFRMTISAVNDAPTLVLLLPDALSAEDRPVDVVLPTGSFTDVDGDALTLTALLTNGNPLPSWLGFNAATQRFTGQPPVNLISALQQVTVQ
jgi:Putative Ig domain